MNYVRGYYLPTPKVLRKIGDSLLLCAGSLSMALNVVPFLQQDRRIGWVYVCMLIAGKFLTNIFAVSNSEDSKNVSDTNNAKNT